MKHCCLCNGQVFLDILSHAVCMRRKVGQLKDLLSTPDTCSAISDSKQPNNSSQAQVHTQSLLTETDQELTRLDTTAVNMDQAHSGTFQKAGQQHAVLVAQWKLVALILDRLFLICLSLRQHRSYHPLLPAHHKPWFAYWCPSFWTETSNLSHRYETAWAIGTSLYQYRSLLGIIWKQTNNATAHSSCHHFTWPICPSDPPDPASCAEPVTYVVLRL